MRINRLVLRAAYVRKNWGGLWSIDDHELTNEEAHVFVDRAIAAGHTVDEDVPEDMIREWIGLNKKEVAK